MSEVTIKPLDLKAFFKKCATTIPSNNHKYPIITHSIDGKLICSARSKDKLLVSDFFLVKLDNPLLIQRYMVIVREYNAIAKSTATTIRRYFSELGTAKLWINTN